MSETFQDQTHEAPQTPPKGATRARKNSDKDARRQHLLQTAQALLRRQSFAELTMVQIAQEAKLAKGTTYLYFKSKEELFLGLLSQELDAWFDNLDLELEQTLQHSPTSLAHLIAESLQNRQNLTQLLGIQASVLEQNISLEAAHQFKSLLAKRAARTGILLEHALHLPAGSGLELLQTINAIVVGLAQLCNTNPLITAVLEHPKLAALKIEFQPHLTRTLETLLTGLKAQENP